MTSQWEAGGHELVSLLLQSSQATQGHSSCQEGVEQKSSNSIRSPILLKEVQGSNRIDNLQPSSPKQWQAQQTNKHPVLQS